MEKNLKKRERSRLRREKRVRKKICGIPSKPRLCITRSNKHLFVQIIDDEKGYTVASISTMSKEVASHKKSKESAKELGKTIATLAKEKDIHRVVFDRGRYKYHGLLALVADGAREGGLEF